MKIRSRQGITYRTPGNTVNQYAVVLNVNHDYIEVMPVFKADRYTKCYDEEGAVKERDADNVRLRSCPPPFKQLAGDDSKSAFVIATSDNKILFNRDDVAKYQVRVIDDGALISETDRNTIYHHPWFDQREKERINNDRYHRAYDRFSYLMDGVDDCESDKEYC